MCWKMELCINIWRNAHLFIVAVLNIQLCRSCQVPATLARNVVHTASYWERAQEMQQCLCIIYSCLFTWLALFPFSTAIIVSSSLQEASSLSEQIMLYSVATRRANLPCKMNCKQPAKTTGKCQCLWCPQKVVNKNGKCRSQSANHCFQKRISLQQVNAYSLPKFKVNMYRY